MPHVHRFIRKRAESRPRDGSSYSSTCRKLVAPDTAATAPSSRPAIAPFHRSSYSGPNTHAFSSSVGLLGGSSFDCLQVRACRGGECGRSPRSASFRAYFVAYRRIYRTKTIGLDVPDSPESHSHSSHLLGNLVGTLPPFRLHSARRNVRTSLHACCCWTASGSKI